MWLLRSLRGIVTVLCTFVEPRLEPHKWERGITNVVLRNAKYDLNRNPNPAAKQHTTLS